MINKLSVLENLFLFFNREVFRNVISLQLFNEGEVNRSKKGML